MEKKGWKEEKGGREGVKKVRRERNRREGK